MYKKIYWCPKHAVVSLIGRPPVSGNNKIGSNAVTAIGTTSNIHHAAIQSVEPKMAFASSESPSGLKNNRVARNNAGPRISPIRFVSIFG